ncbi:cytochrome P450 6k1 isoform X2 [Bemisia tabaci]|uniref:cytochrome P450 6k1 isoform X2 n=2 Tax=Bemisia tabaci TaxID=7038 RepID=UPI003B28404A
MDFLETLISLPPLLYAPLLVGSLCLVFNYLVYSRRVAQWRKSNIPFLSPSFLIGHKYFWGVGSNSATVVPLDRIYQENKDKDLVAFFIATMPVVLLRKPALIKQIFARNFDEAFKTGFAVSHNDVITPHMLSQSPDKKVWKTHRNALSPMFVTTRFSGKRFAKIRNQISLMWTHVEEARLQGKPINIKEVAGMFFQDIISNSFLALDDNSYVKEGEFRKFLKSLVEPGWGKLLGVFAQMHLQRIPTLESLKFITQKHIETMKSLLQKQIKQRSQTGDQRNDLIDLLIRLKEQDQDGKLDSEMDVTNEMISLGLSLLLGGKSVATVDNMVSFTIHLLSLYPEYQERIRQEVKEAMEKHNATEFTYEVVRDLHFLNQCLHETSRLYPNTSVITRVCTEDFTPAGTDYIFKEGELIIVDPYSIHRDPEYFENPDVFDPDRFSPKNRDSKSVDAFLSFGKGPRKCPGSNVALLVASTLIGSLLHKYEVRPYSHTKQMDADDFHPRSFAIVHKDDVLVNVIPREILAY